MKRRNWIKVTSKDAKGKPKSKYPKDGLCVFVYMNNGNGEFCIFTAHRNANSWVSWDHFANVFRIYQHPELITHWAHMLQSPTTSTKGKSK